MMVTTEMTAATPTTIPIKVSAVRSLLARRLAVATRNASQIAVSRKNDSDCWPRKSTKSTKQTRYFLLCILCLFVGALLNSFVLLDLTVTNRDHAVRAVRNVVLVRNHDDRVAFRVETLE